MIPWSGVQQRGAKGDRALFELGSNKASVPTLLFLTFTCPFTDGKITFTDASLEVRNTA